MMEKKIIGKFLLSVGAGTIILIIFTLLGISISGGVMDWRYLLFYMVGGFIAFSVSYIIARKK